MISMTNISMTIGERIKALRLEKGMTQDALAERLGVSAQAVSKWERGITYPDITLIRRLTEIFGITSDELLGLTQPIKSDKYGQYAKEYARWQGGYRSEEAYWAARSAVADYPDDYTFEMWLASAELWLAFEENLKPDPDSAYFETLMENALRRYDHITETCPNPALRNLGILGKITVLRFTERIEEADWSAEFEYPAPDIHTAEEAMALCADGRKVLGYLATEFCI